MLGILKKIWSRQDESDVAVAPPPAPTVRPPAPPLPKPTPRKVAPPARAALAPQPATSQFQSKAAPLATPIAGFINITLRSIESSVPEALRHKIAGALHELVPVPINLIAPQLGRGTVTVTVKQLRECAPELLASFQGHDDIPVALPLAEIVKQMPTSAYTRRDQQRRVSVPEAVTPIFTQTANGEFKTAEPPPPSVRVTNSSIPAAASAPVKAAVSPAPAESPAPSPSKISLSPEALAALGAASAKPAAARPVQPASAMPGAPAAMKLPSTPSLPKPAVTTPKPVLTPAPAATPSAAEAAKLPVPLAKFSDSLPAEVRREITDVDVNSTTMHLPMAQVESGLKTGKVLFTWNELANAMEPPLPRPPSKSASELLVELPLRFMAPIFMAHHRATSAQKKASVGENIPDLFQSNSGPATVQSAAPAAEVKPVAAPTPAPVSKTPAPAPIPQPAPAAAKAVAQSPVPATPGVSLESIVGPEAKRFAPKQIVANAAKLPGVTGALLALSDGLPVTSNLPPTVKVDAVAAFLPQMFGRMSQYTKELDFGALKQLTLTVEGGCWTIFKQQNIYFAACGKSGEAMPVNLLAQVAAELSKQTN